MSRLEGGAPGTAPVQTVAAIPGKLTEKVTIHFDYGTGERLKAASARLGVHHAVLLRAFIARGLQQAEAARDA